MPKKDKTLRKLLKHYDRDNELSPAYVATLGFSVKRFDAFLGRPARVSDLTHKKVNRWMQFEREETELSDRSRANGLSHIVTLWKYTGKPLDRSKIRKVKVRPKNPDAWKQDELRLVADAMYRLPGKLRNGVPRSLYFPTVIWFAFETGLRRRDIWDFRVDWLEGNRATLSQHKTGHIHLVEVSDETLDGLKKVATILEANDDEHASTPLRWPQSESQFYYWFRRAREIANVDPDIVNRALQHMRRTGATAVCRDGGDAFRYLGHTKEGLDRLSYVDRIQTAQAISPSIKRAAEQGLKIA